MKWSDPFPARAATTDGNNKSDNIKLATWILLGVTVATFVARQVMKAIVFRKLALDDYFILTATVFAIGLSITISILASEGLGVLSPMNIAQSDILMKGYYASEFLYISSLCFSKLSLLVLFYTVVAIQRTHRLLVSAFGAFIVIWSIASIVVVAFQCKLPRPWEIMTLQCFNTRAFWIFYCIIDMSTEVSIIMLSFNLVVYLRIRFSRKVAVVACFAPRALVAAASLVRLVWLYPITPHNNPEFKLWVPAILSQIQVCLSICTACIPYMVPFFKGLEETLRRTYSSKSPDFRLDARRKRVSSPLWFRRQKKTQTRSLRDPPAVSNVQYERVPEVSPHIPTPRPMSPMTPPRYYSRPSTAKSGSLNHRGLRIGIPDSRTISFVGPQTASSCALSPSCTPDSFPSIHAFIPNRKAPTPPSKTHSPIPSTASTHGSYRNSSSTSVQGTHRFSLFPQPQVRQNRYSPDLRNGGFTPVAIPPIRSMQSSGVNSNETQITGSRLPGPRSTPSSSLQPPRLDTSPRPLPATISPTSKPQHLSLQEMNSPMGAAINDYFKTAASEPLPSTPMPAAAPQSAYRERNRQILSPSNTLRIQNTPLRSPPLATHDVVRNELGLPRNSIILTPPPRSQRSPSIHNIRGSPRLISHDSPYI